MICDEKLLPYSVGGLLYTPALNRTIVNKIINDEIPALTALTFCLEDSIMDDSLEEAERQLKDSLERISSSGKAIAPLLFVRVRTPQHLKRIHCLLGEEKKVLTGYVLPKFDLTNANEYAKLINQINGELNNHKLYIMPILESQSIANIGARVDVLWEIKSILNSVKPYVLNIRVGGNDLSNMYGIRRTPNRSIYDCGVIRDILVNIVNVFASDYVVSGPVWEYFESRTLDRQWEIGLRNEIELDLLNGFFGKTAIHPSQLPIIFDELKVSENDYSDAMSIVNWQDSGLVVGKSDASRMNEVKCHSKWAEKILVRAKIYGIKAINSAEKES